MWYKKAIEETPYLREPLIELATLYLKEERYNDMLLILLRAKFIKSKYKSYINEPFAWDNTLDDLLSIAYYNLGLKEEALFYVNKALESDANNERLLNNKKLMES